MLGITVGSKNIAVNRVENQSFSVWGLHSLHVKTDILIAVMYQNMNY